MTFILPEEQYCDPQRVAVLDLNAYAFDSHEWELGYQYSRCPRRSREILLSRGTGESRPDYCAANFCLYCSHVKARLNARALGRAEPEALVTLSRAGESWPQTNTRMRSLLQSVRRYHPALAVAWVVEADRSGRHIHALAHGGVLAASRWSEYAQRAGMGRHVDVRTVRECPLRVGGYLMKGLDKDPRQHLELNGGRAVHASRSYWRVEGRPVAGLREAIRASRQPPRSQGRAS